MKERKKERKINRNQELISYYVFFYYHISCHWYFKTVDRTKLTEPKFFPREKLVFPQNIHKMLSRLLTSLTGIKYQIIQYEIIDYILTLAFCSFCFLYDNISIYRFKYIISWWLKLYESNFGRFIGFRSKYGKLFNKDLLSRVLIQLEAIYIHII